jgi:hypothetical protein
MLLGSRPGRLLAGATVLGLVSLVPAGVAQAASNDGKNAPCAPLVPFRSENFGDPTRIDNEYLPMVPGTRLTYEGHVSDAGGALPHRVIFTVTDFTKEVDGVRTRVVYDVDESDGQLDEAELAFFAQDDPGNVWSLGEYPEEYENGRFAGAPDVWLAGLEGASAGIHMPADAEDLVRGPEYLQGEAPSIEFLDCAQVAKENGTVHVPAGDFRDVLTTYERSPLESTSAIQIKEHAPGVGIVRISARHDPEAETLELVSVERLQGSSLRAVNDAVVRLDEHGRKVSDVYRGSSELRRITDGDGDGVGDGPDRHDD